VPETLSANVTGLLLPPGNAPAWRNAILRMCDGDVRETMGVAARDFVDRHFSTRVIADEFVSILGDS
jgi:glycosyltransferase involved in cell wall biosynthesis